MDQLLTNYRPQNRLKTFSRVAETLLVVVVTGIPLHALVPIAHGLSRDFAAWLQGLPVGALVPALIIGCTVWVLSIYLLVRVRLAKGDR